MLVVRTRMEKVYLLVGARGHVGSVKALVLKFKFVDLVYSAQCLLSPRNDLSPWLNLAT